MKLKRLLSGVTAAIMALSSVAIASFTTASAANDPVKPTAGWYKSDEGTLEGGQLKLIQQWDANSKFPAIQNKKFYVAFEVKGVSEGTTAYLSLSNGNDVQAWDADDAGNPAISTPKDGKYVLSFDKNTSDVTQFLAVIFKKDGAEDYGITSAKLIGCYLEDPTEELGIGSGGGDDPAPAPAGGIDIQLLDNNSAQIGTQTVTVDKDGQYELKIDGISLGAQSAFFIKSTQEVKGTVANENALITVDAVTVNGKEATIPDVMKNVSAYAWDAGNYLKFDIYNAWNASNSITLPTGVSTIESISIKFTLKDVMKSTTPDPEPGPAPVPGGDKVIAAPFYADGTWYVQYNHTPEVEITGDGQYKITIPAIDSQGNPVDPVSGAECLVVDFLDCKNDFSFDAVVDSVTCDGKELDLDASKALFGDLEDDNDHLRLEIYNKYGDTNDLGGAIDPLDIEFSDEMVITFTVSNFKTLAKPNPNPPTKPDPTKPTVATPTKPAPATKKTRSKDAVKKDKKAAQKAMKQAKLNSLKVKSKAKKKINVTWKKVKKAKGYQVQVSTNKKFKKSKIIFKKDLKKTKLNIKNKKIKSKKTYYVRVRAYATYKNVNNKTVKVFSKWNKKLRKVKVK